MKVLMVSSYNYVLGGIERVVFETTSMLEAEGHEVIPFAMKDARNRPGRFNKYFVEQRDISKVTHNIEGLVTACKMIYNSEARRNISLLIDEVKPDIAHIHHMYGRLTPSILFELKKGKVPVVMTVHDYRLICPNNKLFSKDTICEKCINHGSHHAILNRCVKDSYAASTAYFLEFYLYKLAGTYNKYIDAFIVPSRFMQKKLIDSGYSASKITHIYNFLNLEDYCASYRKDDYILYFGRLSAEKGLSLLLEAMEYNRNRKLVIAGAGELEQSLKAKAIEKGLNVDFCGFKSGDELKELVKKARVVVAPSIWYENNPMVVLESFALGTPVIGSDVGGIPELIRDGVNGFLFRNGDSKDLADKIRIMFECENSTLEQMGKSARQFVEEHFCRERHYESLFKLYQQLMRNHDQIG